MILPWNKRPTKTPIGLDVGEGGVRAVQLSVQKGTQPPCKGTQSPCKGRYTVCQSAVSESLRKANDLDAPPDPKADGDTVPLQGDAAPLQGVAAEPPRELAQRIQSCVRSRTFQGRTVVSALDPPAIEFHTLELPQAVVKGSTVDIRQVVQWELQRLMSEPDDPSCRFETRHWVAPSPPRPTARLQQSGTATAIGIAARQDAILRLVRGCGYAGLRCCCVDVGAAALCRLGSMLKAWHPDEVWGLLDIGHSQTRLILCVEGNTALPQGNAAPTQWVPVLVRRGGSGGRAWTDRIAESLQLSVKAAEVQKCDQGIARTGAGSRPKNGQTSQSQEDHHCDSEVPLILLGALRSELKDLAAEVKRSYEYVLSCYPGRRASDLVLVGGGSAMRNLPDFLSDALGIPVRRASDYLNGPTCRIDYRCSQPTTPLQEGCVPGGRFRHRFECLAMAAGLAIAHEDDHGPS